MREHAYNSMPHLCGFAPRSLLGVCLHGWWARNPARLNFPRSRTEFGLSYD